MHDIDVFSLVGFAVTSESNAINYRNNLEAGTYCNETGVANMESAGGIIEDGADERELDSFMMQCDVFLNRPLVVEPVDCSLEADAQEGLVDRKLEHQFSASVANYVA